MNAMFRNLVYALLFLCCFAVNTHNANGSDNPDNGELSFLQKHVSFFDKDNDGIVYPSETYDGFMSIGAGKKLSLLASVAINGALSYSTLPWKITHIPLTIMSWIPDPQLPIYIKNIHKAMHGSDSGVYDSQGRFVPAKFEEIFSKYAIIHGDSLTREELDAMLVGNQDPNDSFGRTAAKAEWNILYDLATDENGLLHKEAVRGVYDGSLFGYMKNKNAPK